MTNDLERRLAEHRAGRGSQWVAQWLPVDVVYALEGLSYLSAWRVERYIKTLPRARKEALIAGEARTVVLVGKRIGEG
jgi:predicted GIY-YIG superfamily endonuclease